MDEKIGRSQEKTREANCRDPEINDLKNEPGHTRRPEKIGRPDQKVGRISQITGLSKEKSRYTEESGQETGRTATVRETLTCQPQTSPNIENLKNRHCSS
jgi:hypothetical protein